ncbi:kinesin-like protein KIF14 [Suncus etruscus]|uniref:kinesin-like protein KIF14 n=1 Tax=Suncus etruscus TaxID=109475 RepID=UPI0021102DC3|nr:kinesin-like protein KIF14 [Suncus etruscus]
MPVSWTKARDSTHVLSTPSSQKTPYLHGLTHSNRLKPHLKSSMSEQAKAEPSRRLANHIRDTYVISACKKPRSAPLLPDSGEKLTLRRRTTRSKDSLLPDEQLGDTTENPPEIQLPLGHTKTGQEEKQKTAQEGEGEHTNVLSTNVKLVMADKDSLTTALGPLADDPKDRLVDKKCEGTFLVPSRANEPGSPKGLSNRAPGGSQRQNLPKAAESKGVGQVPGTGNFQPARVRKDVKQADKLGSFEKTTPAKCASECRWTPKCSTPKPKSPAVSILRDRISGPQGRPKSQCAHPSDRPERAQEVTLRSTEETMAQSFLADLDSLKVENSQVTVAVRVRPFSTREKMEKASQVVFQKGKEIAVEHLDMKQVYHFAYDVSFWSFDESQADYASQSTVYTTLAAPLLQRAFDGYNTCLFAYGQTGSGKSYTMMGFSEEPGIIPRFCEDLFAQVAKKQSQEVIYQLEMSFFEVYNEKIHDLLVGKGENRQRKQPLRVREHPVSGPYVEALSMNVVSSYADIQSWLELGNKQRATAATGMNDKSSRSHSVFTLVMTQTRTELVEGEEHDHRITSRINLIDLAGSERCSTAHTSGDRMKEGVSINKSLLTLGKVISALSEQANRKKVFIPYRESVLTWLLKESLGGNSKTAMIATISPAASSMEETLSTLRYASQARMIVNVAKVNEDVNARLIRELKAEIEKLKAAQRNHRNIDPERYRMCQQEITSLRIKLHQQEWDMVQLQRMWKEKFEKAEKRKLQETKELQKAGITFQMDNHLPNLVNLNEDPQLSEMLLYMIKEGTTTVGKYQPDSTHDIQLSGVLIADDHCSIRNIGGTVSITPTGDAKTYVNGKHILLPTVLHHGDRVILGGDHYFRFNHPGEVQKEKRPSCRETSVTEGPKDFEFAKNELLVALRSQLEEEIKEAQLKAKEEMTQGIQIAKEMAQQELSSQKAAYESKIRALEIELQEEIKSKKMQEINHQKASHKIEELEMAKQRLEQEVDVNNKRLKMEALAAKQALEDHRIRHARILEALELEKEKIANEVQILQQNQSNRDKRFTIQPNWSSLKLSMMIQEANTISNRLKKYYVFSRHYVSDKGSRPNTSIQVRNLQLGISTFWSLEKFESKLAALKELYESDSNSKYEDVFCDPEDEWEPDITSVPVSLFSRRRSRSLMKNRRISGCLHDVQDHPVQNLSSSHSSGMMEKSSIIYPNTAESVIPGICKELICSSLDVFEQSYNEEKTMADSLLSNFLKIYNGLYAILKVYEEQDEESQDNLFSDRGTQSLTLQVTFAFGHLAMLMQHWLAGIPPCYNSPRLEDELRQEVKQIGGYLQLFLQGCSSEISSMVKEAHGKVTQTVQQAVKSVGQLAVLTGSKLHFLENISKATSVQKEFLDAIYDGVNIGMKILFNSGLEQAKELQLSLSRQDAHCEVSRQMKAHIMELIVSLENFFTEWKTKSCSTQGQEENPEYHNLKTMANLASKFLKLNQCLEQTLQMTISALRGLPTDKNVFKNSIENLCSLVGGLQAGLAVHTTSTDGGGKRGPGFGLQELASAARSLLLCLDPDTSPDIQRLWVACSESRRGGSESSNNTSGPEPEQVWEPFTTAPTINSGDYTHRRIQWV